LFNIGRTISEDIPAILGIPNLIPIEILLIFNESESLKLSSSISDCALNDIEKKNKKNIPVIFYFNGTHEDYHQPTDTPDKINYEMLEKRTRLIFYTAWELANREERMKLKLN